MSIPLVPPITVLPLLRESVISTGFRIPKGRLATVLPVAAAVFGAYLRCNSSSQKDGWVNKTIDKDSRKVVHTFDVEDIGSRVAYCRCWKSQKFPYCDGAHGKHNRETGDNVGPLIIKRGGASNPHPVQ